MTQLLEIKNLNIGFETLRGFVEPVQNLNLNLNEGETLGIVGESGSGKSLTSLAIMGLLPANAKITSQALKFQNINLTDLNDEELRKLRGLKMAMIFQDPMTSLNPSFTVGFQIIETLKTHFGGTKEELKNKAIDLLKSVGIPDPQRCLDSYAYQLSGGMCQRVMIAIAISCQPQLLIADEPTTALDVTIQSQILDLIRNLQFEKKMSLILITHDIGVVAEMTDRICVMYAGEIVEAGRTEEVITHPKHPYTAALLNCLPSRHQKNAFRAKLPSIQGLVPDLSQRPIGCQFSPRCQKASERCFAEKPIITEMVNQHQFRCFFPIGEIL